MSHNRDISVKHEKWIVKLTIMKKPYYILWGYDTTTFNHDNKILVDENNKVVLFKSIKRLLEYSKKSKMLFDKTETTKWLKGLNKNIRANYHINIDLLTNKKLSISRREDFNELILALDIPDDYAHCTDDKKMLKVVLSPQLRNLFDYNCNLYLWSRDEKKIAANERKLKPDKVVLLLNKLYNLFLQKTVLVK